ncbi:MAG: transketolase, partial [Calditrichia bacterium]|nr:transketolase [Calditrichia bacterium]
MSVDIKKLERIATELRIKVIQMMEKATSGHAGGSMSVAEMVSVLYFHEMNINPKDPNDPDRDRFILSKGHACFTVYAALAKIGYVDEEVLNHPYEVDSPVQGHPELNDFPGIDMGAGALGQGISAGIGMALGARIQKRNYRTHVIIGDGESMEGQNWEAAMLAPKYKLDNLVAFLDFNKMALSGPISEIMPLDPMPDKWKAFGWHVIEIDGHSVPEIVQALEDARKVKGKPTMIVAHTVKGKG